MRERYTYLYRHLQFRIRRQLPCASCNHISIGTLASGRPRGDFDLPGLLDAAGFYLRAGQQVERPNVENT
jgi:hypothetical protein